MKKIVFLGDSTMQYNDESTYPQVGWPQSIYPMINEDVEIFNFAKNGCSTKTFQEFGYFSKALEVIDSNSIVLIQFGHNDGHTKDPERFTRPDFEYKDNLIHMINECKNKKAYVLLLTPIYRRWFKDDGTLDETCHKGYHEAMLKVSKDTKTDLIDMTVLTRDLIQALGKIKSKEMFMQFGPNEYPNYPDGMEDNTHLVMCGAKKVAHLFLNAIKNNDKFKNIFKMYKIIHTSPVSITIELDNEKPYYAENEFDIYLNDTFIRKERRNVFSIFNLKPNTEYKLRVLNYETTFKTLMVNETINVLDYGVINDGKYLNTNSIQKILDNSDNKLVVFPKGKYYTGPLSFKSNSYVYFEKDAELIGSVNRNDYPIISAYGEKDGKTVVNGSWEGEPNDVYMSLITIVDQENIMILGEGTINGNADNADWWNEHRIKKGAWRPNNLFTNRSKNIDIVGLSIKNSPCWNLHPFYSSNINFIDLYLKSKYTSPNTDGCDPESCDHVNLLGTRICVGDDCVAIKSGKYIMSQKFYRPCEYITIRNCYMGDGHGGVVFGSESSCGIKHVNVSKCIFEKTDRGLRIKTKRGRGNKAIIEDVNFDIIKMNEVKTPLVVNMFYYLSYVGFNKKEDSKEFVSFDEYTPHLGKLVFKNMECLKTKICVGYFYGLPESMIESIEIDNIKVTYDNDFKDFEAPAMLHECEKLNKGGFYFYNVDEIKIKNIDIDNSENKYHTNNVKKVIME